MRLLDNMVVWTKVLPARISGYAKRLFGTEEAGVTLGERVADRFATLVGSWTFILCQSFIMMCWVTANICALVYQWDPYPFILLNLFLSMQAAYTGPVIMMSQNRQAQIDRETMKQHFELSSKIAKIVEMHEENRKQQLALLKEILEEVENQDD